MIDDVKDKNEDDGEHMIKRTFRKTGELIEEAKASIKARRLGVGGVGWAWSWWSTPRGWSLHGDGCVCGSGAAGSVAKTPVVNGKIAKERARKNQARQHRL